MKKHLVLTLIVSISFGTILPLALGIKDLTVIAISFTFVWFIYAVLLLITTFLIKLGLGIKVSRKDGATVVRYELTGKGSH
jgi:hypothetical protein